ncbi:MAG: hypothetical protein FWD64_14250, partial [Acidobacteriaceae bacterium]|nr:hypothetical protein [Acidobacteriaceae bacterium]
MPICVYHISHRTLDILPSGDHDTDSPLLYPIEKSWNSLKCKRAAPITRSYFSSVNATLPAAEKTGRMTLRPFSVAHSVSFDAKTRRATGVRVIDGRTRSALEFKAKVVFL